MKKLALLLLLVPFSIFGQSFLNRVTNNPPGIYGEVTFAPESTLKIYGHDDNYKVSAGAKFELLSRQAIRDNIDLTTIKIKIINDPKILSNNGKVGYMYPSSTNLDCIDYTAMQITCPEGNYYGLSESEVADITGNANIDIATKGNFTDRVPNNPPGIFGEVTFSPEASLKVNSHDDSYKITAGSKFELMSRSAIDDNSGLTTIKVKIISDPKNKANIGRVGYMYPASTNLECMDYNIDEVICPAGDYFGMSEDDVAAKTSTKESSNIKESVALISGKAYLNQVETMNTGVTGKVTFDGAFLRMDNFDDFSTGISEGTTFDLLNLQMVEDNISLPCMKIKITSGTHTGKIGYMYPALTTLTDYVNYDNNRIEGATKGGSSSSSKGNVADLSGKAYLNQIETVSTGITGKVTFDGAFLRINNFNDFDTAIDEGTPFKLLNRQMVEDDVPLPCMKIEITAGRHTGKVGYMYPALTNLTDRVNYDTNRIE